MRIFVASTYEDLLNYRDAATRSILTTGNIPEDMLFWPAEGSSPLDVSIRQLKACDLLVLLIAHRYGEPPEGYHASITELEFNEAVILELPILAFIVDSTYPWPPNYIEKESTARERLETFIQNVGKRVVCQKFTSPESLEVAITHALTKLIRHDRNKGLPRYAWARARQVSRPNSLHYSADSVIQIGRAPDSAPLVLSITRHIRIEEDLGIIANHLGRTLRDSAFREILGQLKQAARAFASAGGICESIANGSRGEFYVPNEPMTHQVTPSLFQSMLELDSNIITTTCSEISHPDVQRSSFNRNKLLNIPSTSSFGAGFRQPSSMPGAPALGEHSVDSGRPLDQMSLAVSGFESGEAEPRVISLGGMNRFLCIALDSSPTTWSGGWVVSPSGQRKLIIGRPFIEEGLERLPGVEYAIQMPINSGARQKIDLVKFSQPELFVQKWTELLSSSDEAELSQTSYKITIPRSSIARFTLEVIAEVSELHDRGQVHGDIKPSNILVSRNGALLIDDAGLNIGDISPTVTPGWSPCEQLLRKPLDAAADIFSLGQLLLHLLSAEPLGREVRYRMPGGQMALIFDDPTVYIDPGNPNAPRETREDWCRLIERALRTTPSERWPTAKSITDEMHALLDKEDLRGEVEIRLPWGMRPSLVLDTNGRPTAGWVIESGHERTLLGG